MKTFYLILLFATGFTGCLASPDSILYPSNYERNRPDDPNQRCAGVNAVRMCNVWGSGRLQRKNATYYNCHCVRL